MRRNRNKKQATKIDKVLKTLFDLAKKNNLKVCAHYDKISKDTIGGKQQWKDSKKQIEAVLDEHDEFRDPEFPPELDRLETLTVQNQRLASYFGWSRLQKFFKKEKFHIYQKTQFKNHIIRNRGYVYISDALNLLATQPSLVHRLFERKRTSREGIYAVWIYASGRWTQMIVDDYVPLYVDHKEKTHFFFTTPNQTANEIWYILLEKAMAKAVGGYINLHNGFENHAVTDLTGAPYSFVDIPHIARSKEIRKREIEHMEKFYNKLHKSLDKGYLLSVVPRKPSQMERLAAREQAIPNKTHYLSNGLYSGHNYAVICSLECRNSAGDKEKIIKLSNCYLGETWKGAWSFESEKWTPQLRKTLHYERKEDHLGTFWMSLKDFMHYFECLNIYKTVPGFTFNSTQLEFKNERYVRAVVRISISKKGKYTFSVNQRDLRKYCRHKLAYSPVKLTLGKLEPKKFSLLAHTSSEKLRSTYIRKLIDKGEYYLLIEKHNNEASRELIKTDEEKFEEINDVSVSSYGPATAAIKVIDEEDEENANILYNYICYHGWKDYSSFRIGRKMSEFPVNFFDETWNKMSLYLLKIPDSMIYAFKNEHDFGVELKAKIVPIFNKEIVGPEGRVSFEHEFSMNAGCTDVFMIREKEDLEDPTGRKINTQFEMTSIVGMKYRGTKGVPVSFEAIYEHVMKDKASKKSCEAERDRESSQAGLYHMWRGGEKIVEEDAGEIKMKTKRYTSPVRQELYEDIVHISDEIKKMEQENNEAGRRIIQKKREVSKSIAGRKTRPSGVATGLASPNLESASKIKFKEGFADDGNQIQKLGLGTAPGKSILKKGSNNNQDREQNNLRIYEGQEGQDPNQQEDLSEVIGVLRTELVGLEMNRLRRLVKYYGIHTFTLIYQLDQTLLGQLKQKVQQDEELTVLFNQVSSLGVEDYDQRQERVEQAKIKQNQQELQKLQQQQEELELRKQLEEKKRMIEERLRKELEHQQRLMVVLEKEARKQKEIESEVPEDAKKQSNMQSGTPSANPPADLQSVSTQNRSPQKHLAKGAPAVIHSPRGHQLTSPSVRTEPVSERGKNEVFNLEGLPQKGQSPQGRLGSKRKSTLDDRELNQRGEADSASRNPQSTRDPDPRDSMTRYKPRSSRDHKDKENSSPTLPSVKASQKMFGELKNLGRGPVNTAGDDLLLPINSDNKDMQESPIFVNSGQEGSKPFTIEVRNFKVADQPSKMDDFHLSKKSAQSKNAQSQRMLSPIERIRNRIDNIKNLQKSKSKIVSPKTATLAPSETSKLVDRSQALVSETCNTEFFPTQQSHKRIVNLEEGSRRLEELKLKYQKKKGLVPYNVPQKTGSREKKVELPQKERISVNMDGRYSKAAISGDLPALKHSSSVDFNPYRNSSYQPLSKSFTEDALLFKIRGSGHNQQVQISGVLFDHMRETRNAKNEDDLLNKIKKANRIAENRQQDHKGIKRSKLIAKSQDRDLVATIHPGNKRRWKKDQIKNIPNNLKQFDKEINFERRKRVEGIIKDNYREQMFKRAKEKQRQQLGPQNGRVGRSSVEFNNLARTGGVQQGKASGKKFRHSQGFNPSTMSSSGLGVLGGDSRGNMKPSKRFLKQRNYDNSLKEYAIDAKSRAILEKAQRIVQDKDKESGLKNLKNQGGNYQGKGRKGKLGKKRSRGLLGNPISSKYSLKNSRSRKRSSKLDTSKLQNLEKSGILSGLRTKVPTSGKNKSSCLGEKSPHLLNPSNQRSLRPSAKASQKGGREARNTNLSTKIYNQRVLKTPLKKEYTTYTGKYTGKSARHTTMPNYRSDASKYSNHRKDVDIKKLRELIDTKVDDGNATPNLKPHLALRGSQNLDASLQASIIGPSHLGEPKNVILDSPTRPQGKYPSNMTRQPFLSNPRQRRSPIDSTTLNKYNPIRNNFVERSFVGSTIEGSIRGSKAQQQAALSRSGIGLGLQSPGNLQRTTGNKNYAAVKKLPITPAKKDELSSKRGQTTLAASLTEQKNYMSIRQPKNTTSSQQKAGISNRVNLRRPSTQVNQSLNNFDSGHKSPLQTSTTLARAARDGSNQPQQINRSINFGTRKNTAIRQNDVYHSPGHSGLNMRAGQPSRINTSGQQLNNFMEETGAGNRSKRLSSYVNRTGQVERPSLNPDAGRTTMPANAFGQRSHLRTHESSNRAGAQSPQPGYISPRSQNKSIRFPHQTGSALANRTTGGHRVASGYNIQASPNGRIGNNLTTTGGSRMIQGTGTGHESPFRNRMASPLHGGVSGHNHNLSPSRPVQRNHSYYGNQVSSPLRYRSPGGGELGGRQGHYLQGGTTSGRTNRNSYVPSTMYK